MMPEPITRPNPRICDCLRLGAAPTGGSFSMSRPPRCASMDRAPNHPGYRYHVRSWGADRKLKAGRQNDAIDPTATLMRRPHGWLLPSSKTCTLEFRRATPRLSRDGSRGCEQYHDASLVPSAAGIGRAAMLARNILRHADRRPRRNGGNRRSLGRRHPAF
jgi:hypothetical protein